MPRVYNRTSFLSCESGDSNPGNPPSSFDPSILCDIFVISLFDSRNRERESPCLVITNNGQVVLKGDGSVIS